MRLWLFSFEEAARVEHLVCGVLAALLSGFFFFLLFVCVSSWVSEGYFYPSLFAGRAISLDKLSSVELSVVDGR